MSSSKRPYGFTWVQNSGDSARRSVSVSLSAPFGYKVRCWDVRFASPLQRQVR